MVDNRNNPMGPKVVGVTVKTTVTVSKVVKHGDKVVSDTTTVNSSTQRIPVRPSASADAAIAKGLGTGNLHDLDSLLDQAAAQTAPASAAKPLVAPPRSEALAVLDEALQLPPKPRRASEQKAWLMDAYGRLLKAEAAADQAMRDWGSGAITKEQYDPVRLRLWQAQRQVEAVDKGGAVKKEFFAAILPPALGLIDSLEAVPAPPADKAGKEAWLADGRRKLQEAQAADQVLRDAWFDFKALDFGQMTDRGAKLSAFERRLQAVDRELNPPAPQAPGATGRPVTGIGQVPLPPGMPFGNTLGVGQALDRQPNNPITQVGAAVVMPFAILVDVLNLLTLPAGRAK
jgi:hypothetical protein